MGPKLRSLLAFLAIYIAYAAFMLIRYAASGIAFLTVHHGYIWIPEQKELLVLVHRVNAAESANQGGCWFAVHLV